MTFLSMVFALIYQQIQSGESPLHRDEWFHALQTSIRGMGFSPALSFLFYIAVPVLVLHLFLELLEPFLFGFFWIAVAVVILVYSFGRTDVKLLAQRYRSYCLSNDFEAAYLFGQTELGLDVKHEGEITPEQVHVDIEQSLFYASYERGFAVIFFFVLLGPAGALAYRLLQLSRSGSEGELAARVLFYADWIPARLLAAGFALTGDFLGCRDSLVESLSDSSRTAARVLLDVGRAATGFSISGQQYSVSGESAAHEVAEVQALLGRSAGAWLIAISLLVLLV